MNAKRSASPLALPHGKMNNSNLQKKHLSEKALTDFMQFRIVYYNLNIMEHLSNINNCLDVQLHIALFRRYPN